MKTYKPPINRFTSGISVIPASKGTDKPVLFASACQDKFHPGGQKYNGGLKQLNLLIKIARQNGYEGYLVTWDGLHDEFHLSMFLNCQKPDGCAGLFYRDSLHVYMLQVLFWSILSNHQF